MEGIIADNRHSTSCNMTEAYLEQIGMSTFSYSKMLPCLSGENQAWTESTPLF